MTAPPTRKRSLSGVFTCAAMFALGGAVLWGLFQAPRSSSPPSPDLPWAAPARGVRFVSLDVGAPGEEAPSVEAIVEAVRPLDPDFVLLQRVRSEDAVPLAEGLGMQRSFHPQLFQALGTRARGPVGCVVLSKHPLYDARPLQGGGGCFGVWVVSVVEGERFAVASARLGENTAADLARAWQAAGSPPAVAGASLEKGPVRPAGWHDLVRQPTAQSVLADASWEAQETGVATDRKPHVTSVVAARRPRRAPQPGP